MSLKFNKDVLEKIGLKDINNKKDFVSFINEQIKNRVAKTAGERLEVLEARDKILKYIRFEADSENEEESQQGTCMDMCPEKERYQREHLNQYKSFEMRRNEMGTLILDHRLMIKEYSRSSADQDLPLPNELRSSESLLNTIKYILKEILSQAQYKSETDNNWINDWFDFIWNRTRSIRKDITQQRSKDQKSIQIHEICARFHIYCSHKFCDQPPEVFSYKINRDHLVNCLQSLMEFYDDPSTEESPNEAEFRAYIILSNLEDVTNILTKTRRLKPEIRNSPQIKIALKLFFAYNSKNYLKFFRLMLHQNFNYIAACLVHHFVVKMRVEAVKSIAITYKRGYPFDKLCDILCFENEEDAFFFLDKIPVEIKNEETEKYVIFPRNLNDQPKSRRSFKLVEYKFQRLVQQKNQNLCDIIYGSRIRDNNTNYTLSQQSFNANGLYCANDLPDFDLATNDQRPKTPPQRSTDRVLFGASNLAQSLATAQPSLFQPKINNFRELIDQKPVINPFLKSDNIQPPPRPVSTKFNYVDVTFESFLDELTTIVCYQTLVDERLNFTSNLIFEEIVDKMIREEFQKEIQLVKILTDIRDSILIEATSELIREQFVTDRNSLLKNRFLDSYSNQLFEKIFNDMSSSVLANILAELKYEYLESLYLNIYFTEIYPQHLNEIIQEFVYEDTQFWLNVNSDLASDLQLSIDYSLVKQVFSKWLLKSKKKKQESNYRIEQTKACLFKFVRCESYLLHLSWLTINYQYLIDRLNSTISNNKSLLLYKLMFIIPKLNSNNGDVESIKRWLLSKFFHFDRKTFTYSTQYSYYLLNSFLQQYGIKFCMKAYFVDSSATSEKVENEKMKRIYFGSTGVILILLPFQGDENNSQQFQDYLSEHRNRFRNIIRLVNENLDEDEIISKLKIFIISYLNNEQQTEIAIDIILKPNKSSDLIKSGNISYCVLDGRVVRDNQIVEDNFANFLSHSYINTSKECNSLSILSFFHIFDLTVLKFFEHINKKSHIMSFNSIIEEYNLRLDMLIREFLSKNDYKKLSWPIPEHTDFTKAWLAKFWNTKEVINDKLFEIQNILSLDSVPSINDHDYKKAKHDILSYLHKITKKKADFLDECESIYQVESRIVEILNELELNKKEIKWQKFISIIVEYLLTNGCVKFRSRKIHFDQFTIYCNVNELKSFDWINFGERRIDNYEVSIVAEPTILAQSIERSNETISDKENVDNDSLSFANFEDEPSHFQINRRNYFNKKTNKRLNKEFESKIKNFINVVNKEKAETVTLSDRLKTIVNLNDNSNVVEISTECIKDEKFVNSKKIDSLMSILNEESNHFKNFNDKLTKSLNS